MKPRRSFLLNTGGLPAATLLDKVNELSGDLGVFNGVAYEYGLAHRSPHELHCCYIINFTYGNRRGD